MKQYIVDAFSSELFHGNQAAVCVLDEWLVEIIKAVGKSSNGISNLMSEIETGFTKASTRGPSLCCHNSFGVPFWLLS